MGGTHDTEGDVRFVLSEKMASLKPKGKEPRSIRVLDSWIAHAENELSIGQSGRLAWLIASTVVAAKLQQVIDCAGASRFSLKGIDWDCALAPRRIWMESSRETSKIFLLHSTPS